MGSGIAQLTGCTAHRYHPGVRLTDQEPVATYSASIRNIYPSSCRLTQRVVVRFRGDDYDMIGYLYLRPDGSWSAVALGDMGIELFRFRRFKGLSEVIRHPESMPLAPIRDGVTVDIQHLFGQKEAAPAYLARSPTGDHSLVVELSDDDLEEYQFEEQSGRLVKSRSISNGMIVREASFHGATAFPGINHPLPRRIVLHNYEWGYSMEIELLEMQGGEQHGSALGN